MDDLRLEPGTVLADKYRLGSVIGTGGMGTVYQAEHLALKAQVAVKVIDREVAEGDVALARFMREAQSAASLRSPHVVQILDYGMDGKRPFMVMEMLEGEPLADRIKRLGRLTPPDTYRVISHIARAVHKAHEADIIHRDLKPDNVFLVHNEGDEIAKVLDFGVAKVESTQLDGEGHTRTGSLLGTPFYMSPEQAQGNKDIDARSDLWALGVIAFECLTGKRPFSSDGLGDLVLQICIRDIPVPSQVVPVPKGFDEWFKKACSREPEARFQTARDLAEALRSALDLDSEAGGSVPESRWASAAALGAKESVLSAAPTMSSETTHPDPGATPAPPTPNARATQVDPGAKPTSPEAGLGDSHWEVVPHGSESHIPVRDPAASAPQDAATAEGSGSGGSVAFVAIIALLLGGSIVFGVKQAGVELPWIGKASPLRPSPTVQERPSIRSKKPEPTSPSAEDSNKKARENATSPDGSDNADTQPDEPTGEQTGEENVDDNADATEQPPEGDALDAIEDAAAKAIKERDEATEKNKDKAAPEKDGSKDDGKGPQPKLPDTLTPAPAPPPPPK